jgi:hypothetical protein
MDIATACEALIGQRIVGIELDSTGDLVVLQFETAFMEIEGEDFGVYVEHLEAH